MNRALLSGLLLAAALVGIIHGRSRYADEREAAHREAANEIIERAKRIAAMSGPSAASPHREPSEGAAPAPPPPPSPSAPVRPEPKEPDREKAREAFRQAEAAHARGLYRDEVKLYLSAIEIVKDGEDIESAATRKLAARLAARAKILACLQERALPNDFADGKGLTRIVYLDHEYIVRVVSQDEKEAAMKTASGVELRLAVADIQKVEAFSPDDWRRRVEKGLAERKEKVDEESALELYQIAYYCLENGLAAEASPWLEKALDRDRENLLVQTFCTGADRPSPAEVALARGERQRPARTARRPVEGRPAPPTFPPGPAIEAEPLGGPPAAESAREAALRADPRYQEMIACLEEGRDHYRLSYGSGKRADDELKVATGIFDKAFGFVRELDAAFPDSEECGARLTEISLIRADCHKRTKVGR